MRYRSHAIACGRYVLRRLAVELQSYCNLDFGFYWLVLGAIPCG